MSAKIKLNKFNGVVPENREDKSASEIADLVTLPPNVEGTNCGNCVFVKPLKKEGSVVIGFCQHPNLAQPVSSRMCCALWDNKGALRSWRK